MLVRLDLGDDSFFLRNVEALNFVFWSRRSKKIDAGTTGKHDEHGKNKGVTPGINFQDLMNSKHLVFDVLEEKMTD